VSTYCLWRILGNDLPPRHHETQTEENLRFILENEETLPDCEKRFLLNRIVDLAKLDRFKTLISQYGYEWEEIPFDVHDYRAIPLPQHRAAYLTNVNQARNYCIDRSLCSAEEFEYVLPFDGACFFRRDGWDQLDAVARVNFGDAYFFCPMWRLRHREYVLSTEQAPVIRETYRQSGRGGAEITRIGLTEPQIVFGKSADLTFCERLMYANADKAELLCRLGLAGVWENWEPKGSRGQPIRSDSVHCQQVKMAGFVCRLPSGNLQADTNNRHRGMDRQLGMKLLVDQTDALAEI